MKIPHDVLTQILLNAATSATFEELDKSVSLDMSAGTEFSEKSIKLAQKLSRKILLANDDSTATL